MRPIDEHAEILSAGGCIDFDEEPEPEVFDNTPPEDEDCSALSEVPLPHPLLTPEDARDPFFGSPAMGESLEEDGDTIVDYENLYNHM